MSHGLRRIHNIQTNSDPLWYVIEQKWYIPKHHKMFKLTYNCEICGKPMLTKDICKRCKLKKEKVG